MEPNPALAVKVDNTGTKVKDANMDKALAEGLVKMKAARAIKTAQKEEHRCWNDIIGRSDGGIGYQLLDM